MAPEWVVVVAQLAAATGSAAWEWEHTGGGCYALVCRIGDTFIVVTWADDTFTRGSVPSDVDVHGGYLVGVYAADDEDHWSGATDDTYFASTLAGVVATVASVVGR